MNHFHKNAWKVQEKLTKLQMVSICSEFKLLQKKSIIYIIDYIYSLY